MFGARGQIDLIDYQSSEYKGYRFLLTYIDHGIKFCFCTPIPNKEGNCFYSSFSLGRLPSFKLTMVESSPCCRQATEQDNWSLGGGSEGGD
eukprot:jgi/Tetstr1/454612/TSEL_041504.t1